MQINETPIDRAIRGAGGLALIVSPLLGFATGPYNLLGILPLITGVIGYCPIYALFGFTTCTKDSYQHRKDNVQVKTAKEGTGHEREAHA